MVKMSWNPAAYLEFAAYRARPAEDLIARLDVKVPGGIVDLGCGPGNLTAKLKQRWPSRAVTGFDASPEMLAKARASVAADITWEQGDIAAWLPGAQAALVFANAALPWVPDHAGLFPRLMHAVAPGGLLAVQMPMTGEALYHQCLQRVLDAPRWRTRLQGVHSHAPPLAAAVYYDLLAPLASAVDIWETHYHHVLASPAAVTAWVAGTALLPYTEMLNDAETQVFFADYTSVATTAYPPRTDGKVLFNMKRIFILAERA